MFVSKHLDDNEYFDIETEMREYICRFFAMTGARGCGKTYSFQKKSAKLFEMDWKCLYIRNSRNTIATARQYFSFLEKGDWFINLGSMGASTIVLENKVTGDKILVGYTLWICEYEMLKSSKRQLDYIVYEEFSTFSGGTSINRILALTEIFETISQTNPNFLFFAISNNLYYDDLLENLLDNDMFVHFQITKNVIKNGVKNSAIRAYLQGEYLLPEIVINLKNHKCIGHIEVAETKVYIFESEYYVPKYVLSSTGSGDKMKLDTETIDIIRMSTYKSMRERNKCEFVVGLLLTAGNKLRA